MKRLLAIGAVAVLALGLSACSTPLFDNPQDSLNTVAAGFAIAETTYDAICSVNAPPTFCTDASDKAAYAAAELTISTALKTAQDAINAGNGDVDIDALVQDAVNALATYEAIVNQIKAKNIALHERR